MWDDRVVHVLPEERSAAIAVERDSVGDLDEIELFLLREDLFDVRFKERVGLEHFGSDGSLCGRLDLRLRAWREPVARLAWQLQSNIIRARTDSFLNIVLWVKVCCL